MRITRPTLADVARAAGVAASTASRALNTPDQVTDATRARVQRAAADVGYVPNAAARALRVGRSTSFALVTTTFGDPFLVELATAAEEAALRAGAVVALHSSDGDDERERRLLRRLAERHFDGVVVTPRDVADPLLEVLVARGTKVVVLLREAAGRYCAVRCDDEAGGRTAAAHLLAAGHRRLAYVGPVGPVDAGRLRGASEAAAAAGAELEVIGTAGGTLDDGATACAQLLTREVGDRPTAAVCENDLIAVGVVHEARRRGAVVPDDLAVVGYDDSALANVVSAVALTTLRQPAASMAEAAVALLLEELSDAAHEHRDVVFRPELVVRSSTAPLAAPAGGVR